jgi:hypothetical protein
MNYAYTCRAIEPNARRDSVSFSNHSEVASLDPLSRIQALDKLERKEWTREDVRVFKREQKGLSIVPKPSDNLQDAPVVVMQIGDKAYPVLVLPDDYPVHLLQNWIVRVPKAERKEGAA